MTNTGDAAAYIRIAVDKEILLASGVDEDVDLDLISINYNIGSDADEWTFKETALNPTMRVGDQIAEVIIHHNDISQAESEKRAGQMLEMVGITAERYSDYPHQFSGGMKQRVIIAIALACNPQLLIADEPTGNLDPARSLELMLLMDRINEMGTTVLVVTHEKELVNSFSKRVVAIEDGRVISDGMDGYYSYEIE